MRLQLLSGIRGSLVLFLLATPVWADSWPRFRGPNGTGTSTDKEIPIQWKEGDGLLWKIKLPGLGNSSPIVWGDKLFLEAAKADGSDRQLLCLSVQDGKMVWSQSVPSNKPKTHQKNSAASSTPATDGERIYALFWDGRNVSLHAFDMDGHPLWHRDLGSYKSQHGYGHSPVVVKNRVIVAQDQDDAAEVLAFDAKTGKDAWRATRPPFRACYSTPIVLEKPGQPVELIVASTAGVTSYNPESGTENWVWTWDWSQNKAPLRTVASPIISQGLIFANSGDGSGERMTVAIKDSGRGENGKSQVVWEKRRDTPYVPCMLAHGEHVYYVTDQGMATCAEAKTGAILWRERLGGGVSASPVLIDGKIYAITEDGTVVVFAAAPKFQVLAKNALGEDVIATPAVADNRLYIRTKTYLYCIGKPAERKSAQR